MKYKIPQKNDQFPILSLFSNILFVLGIIIMAFSLMNLIGFFGEVPFKVLISVACFFGGINMILSAELINVLLAIELNTRTKRNLNSNDNNLIETMKSDNIKVYICPNCSTEIPYDNNICHHCGWKKIKDS